MHFSKKYMLITSFTLFRVSRNVIGYIQYHVGFLDRYLQVRQPI